MPVNVRLYTIIRYLNDNFSVFIKSGVGWSLCVNVPGTWFLCQLFVQPFEGLMKSIRVRPCWHGWIVLYYFWTSHSHIKNVSVDKLPPAPSFTPLHTDYCLRDPILLIVVYKKHSAAGLYSKWSLVWFFAFCSHSTLSILQSCFPRPCLPRVSPCSYRLWSPSSPLWYPITVRVGFFLVSSLSLLTWQYSLDRVAKKRIHQLSIFGEPQVGLISARQNKLFYALRINILKLLNLSISTRKLSTLSITYPS